LAVFARPGDPTNGSIRAVVSARARVRDVVVTEAFGYSAMKASNSGFTVSACVVHIPWGKPL